MIENIPYNMRIKKFNEKAASRVGAEPTKHNWVIADNLNKLMLDFLQSYKNLSKFWDDILGGYSEPFNTILTKDYPFTQSFDEISISQWQESINNQLYLYKTNPKKFIIRYVSDELKVGVNEIEERFEEFGVFKGESLDLISLEQLYNFYESNLFRSNDFSSMYKNTIS